MAEEPLRRPFVTLWGVLLLVAGLGLLVGIAYPPMQRWRLSANEVAAIDTMYALARAQSFFREAVIVDQDGDAEGEHGFLGELTGVVPARTLNAPVSPQFLSPGLTRGPWGGVGTRQGYHFLVYLPTASAGLAADPGVAAPAVAADADVQELTFLAYAWPQSCGRTGNRAFAIDARGAIYGTPNRAAQAYSGRDVAI